MDKVKFAFFFVCAKEIVNWSSQPDLCSKVASSSCISLINQSINQSFLSNFIFIFTPIESFVSSGGIVMRALASHQCGPDSIPTLDMTCGLSLLVPYSALRGFSPGLFIFLSPQKPRFDLCLFQVTVS